MDKEFEKRYHELEKSHFWFKARRKYIHSVLKDSPKNISILDIGCSSGILLKELKDLGFSSENLYGIDISETAVENCKANGIRNAFVMDAQKIDMDRNFDVIIASDCMEHLQDDLKALENWNSLLTDGGLLLVFVPAFMFLWSEHDVANMHFRRYTKSQLIDILSSSRFKVKRSGYWNFSLFFPISVIRILNRFNPLKNRKAKHSLGDLPRANEWFYRLVNLENKILRNFNFPFGVSTFCIATKENQETPDLERMSPQCEFQK